MVTGYRRAIVRFSVGLIAGFSIPVIFHHVPASTPGPSTQEMTLFSDPQSVTVNAVAQSLARVEAGSLRGSFSKDDQTFKLSIQHQLGKNAQRMIRLDRTTLTASPFTAGSSYNVVDSVWLVSRTPSGDLPIATQKQLIDGFLAYLTASSGAKITQFLGGES